MLVLENVNTMMKWKIRTKYFIIDVIGNRTNEEGTGCALCIDDYVLKNGLCVDEYHCIEQNEDGTCKRCFHDYYNSFCINHDFGCIDLIFDYCLECNDSSDLEKCTKCFYGYKINKYDQCDKIEEN